jgi:hypothetical protein
LCKYALNWRHSKQTCSEHGDFEHLFQHNCFAFLIF